MTDEVPCSCCGEGCVASGLAALSCHPEIVICRSCVGWLGEQFGGSHSVAATPILPVRDMAEATTFWETTGHSVERYDGGYAFVMRDGGELLHVTTDPTLDPARNSTACYIHERNVDEVHATWAAAGLPVSVLDDMPWGMREFTVKDPSGNLIRVGRNT